MITVRLPSLLDSYTRGIRVHQLAVANTLAQVLNQLEELFPGVRFRLVDEQEQIRAHIKLYVGQVLANSLDHPLTAGDEILIVGALSGG